MKIRTEKGKYLNVFFSFFFFFFCYRLSFLFFSNSQKHFAIAYNNISPQNNFEKDRAKRERTLKEKQIFFCFWLLNETMSVFFAIRRGWSCHFQKCWTEKNGDCTLRVNMTRMCSETIRKTSIASGERETHFSLKIIGSHHSLSLSLSREDNTA